MIVVDTLRQAVELFGRRSSIYSSRYFICKPSVHSVDCIRPTFSMLDPMRSVDIIFSFKRYCLLSTLFQLLPNAVGPADRCG
jgi:hypothetical protein